jgi:hypothetical protein
MISPDRSWQNGGVLSINDDQASHPEPRIIDGGTGFSELSNQI